MGVTRDYPEPEFVLADLVWMDRPEPECDGCEDCCNHDGEHGYDPDECECKDP